MVGSAKCTFVSFSNSADPAFDTTRRLRPILQAHELWKDQLMDFFEPDVVAAASTTAALELRHTFDGIVVARPAR
jgi:hypothetical protein